MEAHVASAVDHAYPSPEEVGPLDQERPAPIEYDLVVVGDGLTAAAVAREGRASGYRAALATPGGDVQLARFARWAVRNALRQAAWAAHRACHLPDFAMLLHETRQIRTRLLAAHSLDRLAEAGVDVYHGPIAFLRPEALEVGDDELIFRRAILALDAQPGPLGIDGAEQAGCLNSERLLDLEQLPERLAVLGLGPRECLWAQMFRRLGSQVHLVGPAPRILPGELPEAAEIVQRQLEQEGVHLLLDCQPLAIEQTGTQRIVSIQRDGIKEELFADHVFLHRSRRPNLAGLRLDAAEVTTAERGVAVDSCMRTTNRRILAIGEVCGQEFASPAIAEVVARRCVANAFAWWPRPLERLAVARCVWTDPEVVSLGQIEPDGPQALVATDTYRVDVAETDQAVLEQRERGFAMVRVRRATGRIVGACLVADEASELVDPLLLLMAHDLPLAVLLDVMASYPSRFELLQRLADRYRRGPPPSLGLILKEAAGRWRRPSRTRGDTPRL
jgi:pyruvate/2-oxoglutarate dehydrogenase complex dihydrolipoamide dehydrogenase (E3) component